jgi:hypothetical protein
MGRPKAPEDQQLRARDFYLEGLTAKAIVRLLDDEFEEPVSLRTVGRWIADFTSSGLQVNAPEGLALKDRYASTDRTWLMDRRYRGMALKDRYASTGRTWLMDRRYRGMALKDRCDLTDHSWMMDRRYEGTAYTREDATLVANNMMNISSKRTCSFCKLVEITRP